MKNVLQFDPVFTPGAAGAGTLNFSAFPGFLLKNLQAVVNTTRGALIFAPTVGSSLGYSSFSSGVLTLSADTSAHSASDVLACIYDTSTLDQNILSVGGASLTLGSKGYSQSLPVTQSGITSFHAVFSRTNASAMDAVGMTSLYTSTGFVVTQSAGNLNVTASVNTNEEFLAVSTDSFTGSLIGRVRLTGSQRIANNNALFLLADMVQQSAAFTILSATSVQVSLTNNPFTSANIGQSVNIGGINGASGAVPGRYPIAAVSGNNVTFTVAGWPASGTGTCCVFGWNHLQYLETGATTTTSSFDAAQDGWSIGASSITVTSSTSGHEVQLCTDGRTAIVGDYTLGSTTVVGMTSRGSRVERLPRETTPLRAFLWFYNGTTAPASATTWTLSHLSVEAFSNVPVSLFMPRSTGNAVPIPIIANSSNTTQINGAAIAAIAQQGATSTGAQVVGVLGPTTNNSTEVASGVITSSGTGSTITAISGAAFCGLVQVTAASGTSPTLDVVLQESFDNGTTWEDVWHVERLTATGTALIPLRPALGRHRWNHNISGTTPSFTRVINAMYTSASTIPQYQFFDRTAGLLSGTLSATSSGFFIAGTKNISASITLGAATTPASYQIQVSNDRTNWSSVGTATAAIANATTTLSVGNIVARFARLICTAAATGQTGTVVSLTACN